MKTQYIASPSMVDRVRNAAASSLLVRSALIATLGISVTVGGVLAGALVVAPIVTRASQQGTTSQVTRTIAAYGAAGLAASRHLATRGADVVASKVATLPQPMTRYALVGLGMRAMIGAISPRLLRRRTPMRSLATDAATVIESIDAPQLPPRSNGRIGSKRNQTPRAVEALAASGVSTTDIAWKTGLPIDAVQLLLAISTGTRRLQPPAA